MKKSLKKKIPKFKNEDKEREFWSRVDATDYFDISKAKRTLFPNLKPSTKNISLRISEEMLNYIKTMANRRDVPYQSLIKIFLQEKILEEYKKIK